MRYIFGANDLVSDTCMCLLLQEIIPEIRASMHSCICARIQCVLVTVSQIMYAREKDQLAFRVANHRPKWLYSGFKGQNETKTQNLREKLSPKKVFFSLA